MYECYNEEKDFEEYCDGDCESCTACEDCDAFEECEACEECEEIEEEEEDFELEGEPFARAAESKDQE